MNGFAGGRISAVIQLRDLNGNFFFGLSGPAVLFAIPEPSSFLLVAMAAMGLVVRISHSE